MSKESEALRKAAAYIRKHQFSPYYREYEIDSLCGCFVHALRDTGATDQPLINRCCYVLSEVTGASPGLSARDLIANGWTRGATDDAAAALEIAADLAE